jgi:hypothetical protein
MKKCGNIYRSIYLRDAALRDVKLKEKKRIPPF